MTLEEFEKEYKEALKKLEQLIDNASVKPSEGVQSKK